MKIPQTVGKYQIVSALGAGAMGTVYRAFDPTLQRTVALKMINLGLLQDFPAESLATRFRTEARAAAQLSRPDARSSQVSGSVSITFGGVPLV